MDNLEVKKDNLVLAESVRADLLINFPMGGKKNAIFTLTQH